MSHRVYGTNNKVALDVQSLNPLRFSADEAREIGQALIAQADSIDAGGPDAKLRVLRNQHARGIFGYSYNDLTADGKTAIDRIIELEEP